MHLRQVWEGTAGCLAHQRPLGAEKEEDTDPAKILTVAGDEERVSGVRADLELIRCWPGIGTVLTPLLLSPAVPPPGSNIPGV